MSEQPESESIEPDKPSSTSVRSGGADILSDSVDIGGDVVGRDKISTSGDTVAGDKVDINAGPGSKIVLHEQITQIITPPLTEIARPRTKHQWILEKLRDPVWQFIGVIVSLLALIITVWAMNQPPAIAGVKPTPTVVRMAGDFRVAVAGFAVDGQPDNTQLGQELAQGVYLNLQEVFGELKQGFQITIWSPEQTGTIHGATAEERAKSARGLAERIGADVIVYGSIDATQPTWEVTPEFYISAENFYEADEIAGDHELGQPISFPSQSNIAGRIELSSKLKTRMQALAKITVGLAFFSARNYERALEFFRSAEGISDWSDDQGRQVLYLLMGNAAGKNKQADDAKAYYEKSLAIDPAYARPMVGLGSVYYISALKPFDASKKPADTDQTLLDKSIEYYQQSLTAAHQPELADIPTKVHFGLGQAYFMRTYSGHARTFDAAVGEFQQVIAAYGNGINPRVKELAAEAHARLGLIYDLSGHAPESIEEYQTAAALTDDPLRKVQYEDRVQKLQQIRTPSIP